MLSLCAILILSIKDILESISSAAHVLLCLFKKFGSSFMPSQLYNDLMETFKDIYVWAAKYKTWKPDEPFLVASLGTDSLENYFSILRSLHKNGMMDALEIINRSQWIHTAEDILENHQDWKANHYGPKRLKVALHRSKADQWDIDNQLMRNVNIRTAWQKGVHNASMKLISSELFSPNEINFHEFSSTGITMLKPPMKRVSVTEVEYDWSLPEPSDVIDSEADTASIASIDDFIEIPGVAVDAMVRVGDVSMHKASVIRQRFSGQRVSMERLKHIRGMFKFESRKEVDIDKAIMLGDPVIANHRGATIIAIIMKLSINTKFVNYCDAADLKLHVLQLQEMELEVIDDDCVFDGVLKDDTATVTGDKCFPIAPT